MPLTQVQGGMILASGQSIPKAALPTGSVLQVVTVNRSGEASTTSSSFVDAAGLSLSITPTSSTSKIFILYTGSAGVDASQEAYLTLVRNTTNLSGSQGFMRLWFSGSSGYKFGGFSMSYLDSPSTTSATTYKVQFRSNGSNIVYISGGNSTDTLTVFEIAA